MEIDDGGDDDGGDYGDDDDITILLTLDNIIGWEDETLQGGSKGKTRVTAEGKLVNKETGTWAAEGIVLFFLETRRFQGREPPWAGRRMDCFSRLQTPSLVGTSVGVCEGTCVWALLAAERKKALISKQVILPR